MAKFASYYPVILVVSYTCLPNLVAGVCLTGKYDPYSTTGCSEIPLPNFASVAATYNPYNLFNLTYTNVNNPNLLYLNQFPFNNPNTIYNTFPNGSIFVNSTNFNFQVPLSYYSSPAFIFGGLNNNNNLLYNYNYYPPLYTNSPYPNQQIAYPILNGNKAPNYIIPVGIPVPAANSYNIPSYGYGSPAPYAASPSYSASPAYGPSPSYGLYAPSSAVPSYAANPSAYTVNYGASYNAYNPPSAYSSYAPVMQNYYASPLGPQYSYPSPAPASAYAAPMYNYAPAPVAYGPAQPAYGPALNGRK
ncbi:hypothetical protein BV898_11078 [Hypsibius exemplaris]|uniref:Uncharacterized protein n=1 Tax=Hypsibius exemplaris TaxID=2072580 RepID=A0A1W0WHM0_HYPEX|nr:hypothetical protein BV898_11078 [Hypsibius exemplaris]